LRVVLRRLSLALMLLAAVPATAPAATVSVSEREPHKYENGGAFLSFRAAAGERNVVTLERDGGELVIRDTGAPLAAGAGCRPVDAHAARCSSKLAFAFVSIDTLDLDDTVVVPPASVSAGYGSPRVDGGDGADTLSGYGSLGGGPGPDTLTGTPGADLLYGGPGDDVLRGGEGDDLLGGDDGPAQADEVGDDVLDGGPGSDTATYHARQRSVHVDLADPAADGEAGEHDTLTAIERVGGGYASDVLSGDEGPNGLDGGSGDDILTGRGGDDGLSDGIGADTLLGGAGADSLSAENPGDRASGEDGDDTLYGSPGAQLDGGPGADRLDLQRPRTRLNAACGDGADVIGGPFDGQLIDPGCERMALQPDDLLTARVRPARLAAHALGVAARCGTRPGRLRRCAGELILRLRRPGRAPLVLGRRSFSIARGSDRTIGVGIRRAARAALAAQAQPLVDVRFRVRGVVERAGPRASPRADVRWRVRLRSR